jgi:hypothetical protein
MVSATEMAKDASGIKPWNDEFLDALRNDVEPFKKYSSTGINTTMSGDFSTAQKRVRDLVEQPLLVVKSHMYHDRSTIVQTLSLSLILESAK